ncbi:hypothetical protein [Streptomyces sp. SHP 1-2]|uniref:hypothetical protein n=1 Tax=Streptomyces sp. SHP 1-2 TaxID=2769489 RepID=UPI002236F180|nr:hypothetical protein [Streptomyces sp. SHP 1-2]MCW5254308.1 hypothetical protein [Streptomyces sp. SHP 1-2]
MSAGMALPTFDLVMPAVGYPAPLSAADVYQAPHAGSVQLGDALGQASSHVSDAAGQASAHLSDAAGHALHQAGDAVLGALGALSGALFVGRAAMLTTRVLATAAVRAAEEQRCLERREEVSAAAAEQWQAAAYAVARANARRGALLARCARTGGTLPGGGGPPRPDLPPPLDPVGLDLAGARARLARLEAALARAEERQTAWEVERLTSVLEESGDDDAEWRRLLDGHRETMLRRHLAARTAEAERDGAGPEEVPRAAPGTDADAEAVRRLGAGILAALDPGAAHATAELAAASVSRAAQHAGSNPHRCRRHLNEARKLVQDANRTARGRRADEEWAAAQLEFLSLRAPEGTEPLPGAPDAVEPLVRVLERGGRLDAGERRLVERRVSERLSLLEELYLRTQCARVIAELSERYGGPADATRPEGQELRVDWTPDGWGPGHWLRMSVTGGALRVATMYRGGPGERGPGQRELDDLRCAETRQRLGEITALAAELGIGMDFRIEQAEGARPGLPGEDGAVVLDGLDLTAERGTDGARADEERRSPRREPAPAPRHRTVGDDRR